MHYRQLKVFFAWLSDLDDQPSPMRRVAAPMVPEQPVPVLGDDQLRALLATCKGNDFTARRDRAIIRLFFDAGIRRSEMTGITLDDLDRGQQLVRVLGKGRRERVVSYGDHTAEAIDKYIFTRMRHPGRRLPALWLAAPPHTRALGYDGLGQMLERRANAAGVSHVYAHRFRHTAAHTQLDAGLSEGDAMRIFGWKSRTMVDRYGASAAHARAIKAARRTSHADRI